MCHFLSVLVMRDGSIRHHPAIDSHADLIVYYGLRDTELFLRHFAKAELVPGDDWLHPETWTWTLDEPTRPTWLDPETETQAEAAARRVAAAMIHTTGVVPLIVDGAWILGGDVVVKRMLGGRVLAMRNSATVQDVRGSARVQDVWGSARVQRVYVSATVQGVYGSATVQGVSGSARVQGVSGSATVQGVSDSATVQGVSDSARVQDVYGSATVQGVYGSAALDDSARAHLLMEVTS